MKLPGKGLSWKQFLNDLKTEWANDALMDVAGSVTFFAVLAVFPFLIFLVSLASLFINPDSTATVIDSMRNVAPEAVTQILSERIRSLSSQKSVGLLTISAITAIWSASSGVGSIMTALNTCYGVKEQRPFWKTRGIAIGVTILGAVVSLVAAVAVVVLPPVAAHFGGFATTLMVWLRLPAAAVLIMFLWAVIYYLLPDVQQSFKFITPGSVVGVLLWLIASWGFSFYVSHFGNYEVTYGALGGVVILLFWMWISALTLLLGAEINAIIEHRSEDGKRTGAKLRMDTGEDVPKTEKAEKEVRRRRHVRPQTTWNSAGALFFGILLGAVFRRPSS